MKNRTGTDGAHEALEGCLADVALVRTGAYQEAQVTNVIRSSIAKVRAWAAWMTAHKPDVDLGWLPAIPGQPRACFRVAYRLR